MSDCRLTMKGTVAHVVLDRPPVNALTIDSYREICGLFRSLGERNDVHVVILTGAGHKAFCAGFDFRQFAQDGASEDDPDRPAILRNMFEAIRRCPVPVIAAINGAAIGAGCVIAAVCDIRIAADHARIGLPEIDFGRIGGAAYLQRLVPPGVLRRMAFTGRPIGAAGAMRAGFVDEIVAADELESAVMALGNDIATKPALALRRMKSALHAIAGIPEEQAYMIEQDMSVELRTALEAGAP